MRKIVSLLTSIIFLCTSLVPPSVAQEVILPAAQNMLALTPDFTPCLLRGIRIDPKMPLHFDFMVDEGNRHLKDAAFEKEAQRLIRYFLATLTTPEKDLWVNLSPYENDRIIQDNFGRTTMGRDLLAQDYILKQLTASLMHPDNALGKKFWEEIYRKVHEKYGTTDIPVDSFNKVWIVPEHADVFEKKNSDGTMAAFVESARLKVMLESDYVAQARDQRREARTVDTASSLVSGLSAEGTQELAKDVVRSVILPVLEKEVNQGLNFSQLRQVYHSLLLAVWLKKKFQTFSIKKDSAPKPKGHILSLLFVDQKKTDGIETDNPKAEISNIYDRYVEAFKTGAYNLIREDYDLYSNETIPRKYFSGGFSFEATESAMALRSAGRPQNQPDSAMRVSVNLAPKGVKASKSFSYAKSAWVAFKTVLVGSVIMAALLMGTLRSSGGAPQTGPIQTMTAVQVQQIQAELSKSGMMGLSEADWQTNIATIYGRSQAVQNHFTAEQVSTLLKAIVAQQFEAKAGMSREQWEAGVEYVKRVYYGNDATAFSKDAARYSIDNPGAYQIVLGARLNDALSDIDSLLTETRDYWKKTYGTDFDTVMTQRYGDALTPVVVMRLQFGDVEAQKGAVARWTPLQRRAKFLANVFHDRPDSSNAQEPHIQARLFVDGIFRRYSVAQTPTLSRQVAEAVVGAGNNFGKSVDPETKPAVGPQTAPATDALYAYLSDKEINVLGASKNITAAQLRKNMADGVKYNGIRYEGMTWAKYESMLTDAFKKSPALQKAFGTVKQVETQAIVTWLIESSGGLNNILENTNGTTDYGPYQMNSSNGGDLSYMNYPKAVEGFLTHLEKVAADANSHLDGVLLKLKASHPAEYEEIIAHRAILGSLLTDGYYNAGSKDDETAADWFLAIFRPDLKEPNPSGGYAFRGMGLAAMLYGQPELAGTVNALRKAVLSKNMFQKEINVLTTALKEPKNSANESFIQRLKEAQTSLAVEKAKIAELEPVVIKGFSSLKPAAPVKGVASPDSAKAKVGDAAPTPKIDIPAGKALTEKWVIEHFKLPSFATDDDMQKAFKSGELVMVDINGINAKGPLKFSIGDTRGYTYPLINEMLTQLNVELGNAGIQGPVYLSINSAARSLQKQRELQKTVTAAPVAQNSTHTQRSFGGVVITAVDIGYYIKTKDDKRIEVSSSLRKTIIDALASMWRNNQSGIVNVYPEYNGLVSHVSTTNARTLSRVPELKGIIRAESFSALPINQKYVPSLINRLVERGILISPKSGEHKVNPDFKGKSLTGEDIRGYTAPQMDAISKLLQDNVEKAMAAESVMRLRHSRVSYEQLSNLRLGTVPVGAGQAAVELARQEGRISPYSQAGLPDVYLVKDAPGSPLLFFKNVGDFTKEPLRKQINPEGYQAFFVEKDAEGRKKIYVSSSFVDFLSRMHSGVFKGDDVLKDILERLASGRGYDETPSDHLRFLQLLSGIQYALAFQMDKYLTETYPNRWDVPQNEFLPVQFPTGFDADGVLTLDWIKYGTGALLPLRRDMVHNTWKMWMLNDWSVHTPVVNKGKLVLAVRSKAADIGVGEVDSYAGHAKPGESLLDAAKREFAEEYLGIKDISAPEAEFYREALARGAVQFVPVGRHNGFANIRQFIMKENGELLWVPMGEEDSPKWTSQGQVMEVPFEPADVVLVKIMDPKILEYRAKDSSSDMEMSVQEKTFTEWQKKLAQMKPGPSVRKIFGLERTLIPGMSSLIQKTVETEKAMQTEPAMKAGADAVVRELSKKLVYDSRKSTLSFEGKQLLPASATVSWGKIFRYKNMALRIYPMEKGERYIDNFKALSRLGYGLPFLGSEAIQNTKGYMFIATAWINGSTLAENGKISDQDMDMAESLIRGMSAHLLDAIDAQADQIRIGWVEDEAGKKGPVRAYWIDAEVVARVSMRSDLKGVAFERAVRSYEPVAASLPEGPRERLQGFLSGLIEQFASEEDYGTGDQEAAMRVENRGGEPAMKLKDSPEQWVAEAEKILERSVSPEFADARWASSRVRSHMKGGVTNSLTASVTALSVYLTNVEKYSERVKSSFDVGITHLDIFVDFLDDLLRNMETNGKLSDRVKKRIEAALIAGAYSSIPAELKSTFDLLDDSAEWKLLTENRALLVSIRTNYQQIEQELIALQKRVLPDSVMPQGLVAGSEGAERAMAVEMAIQKWPAIARQSRKVVKSAARKPNQMDIAERIFFSDDKVEEMVRLNRPLMEKIFIERGGNFSETGMRDLRRIVKRMIRGSDDKSVSKAIERWLGQDEMTFNDKPDVTIRWRMRAVGLLGASVLGERLSTYMRGAQYQASRAAQVFRRWTAFSVRPEDVYVYYGKENIRHHLSFIRGRVVLSAAEGITIGTAIHEYFHHASKGLDCNWLNEAVTQYLTLQVMAKEGLRVTNYFKSTYAKQQEMLARLAQMIGYEPIILAYLTGDTKILTKAFGNNVIRLFEALDDIDYADLDVAQVYFKRIIKNINSQEQLDEIGYELMERREAIEKGTHNKWSDQSILTAGDLERSVLLPRMNPILGPDEINKMTQGNMFFASVMSLVRPGAVREKEYGGIDLNTDRLDMLIQGNAGNFDIELTPEQVQMLQRDVRGFVPVIINVQPVKDVPGFLGMIEKESTNS